MSTPAIHPPRRPNPLHRFLSRRSPIGLSVSLLLLILYIHSASLYLFTKGFLLSRLALTHIAECSPAESCDITRTHSKAVILIIDSLRYDFISPPPSSPDPYHHGVLTLPLEMTTRHPDRSFIFNAYADPPTATLQRIKGITTGSLPTFIDIGSNFGGSEIHEDSLIHQLHASGRKIAFMGDDTWLTVYPHSFNQSWAFDSFNVEDLHSVDEGVTAHLFPLLEGDPGMWDVAIGHFLGVDHVGHRVGPSCSTMHLKLSQMDTILRRVVASLSDDTLLIVLGDHGMDARGDHGGDGALETSSAMWIYSPSLPLQTESTPITVGRTQQIDLVPTLALLLGIPIPFNNLGMLIPEVFSRRPAAIHEAEGWIPGLSRKKALQGDLILNHALKVNAEQVRTYLSAYRSSASGSELDGAWTRLDALYTPTTSLTDASDLRDALTTFIRETLAECRKLWAQFDVVLMLAGLGALGLSFPVVWMLYNTVEKGRWVDLLSHAGLWGLVGGVGGGAIDNLFATFFKTFGTFNGFLLGSVLGIEASIILSIKGISVGKWSFIPTLILILHSVSFTSNSFLMWEDRIVPFFIMTLLVPSIVTSFAAPSLRLQQRILWFGVLSALLLGAIARSTVCREEQHPYCHVTFYASSSTPVAPLFTTLLAPLLAFTLPYIVRAFLATSKSDAGIAPYYLHWIWKWLLVGGAVYWSLERAEVLGGWQALPIPVQLPFTIPAFFVVPLQQARTWLARGTLTGIVFGCSLLWWDSPLNVEFVREGNQVQVIGFANSYGSSYLVFVTVIFALVFTVSQPTGQVVLALAFIALLAHVEVTDSSNDATGIIEAFTTGEDLTKPLPQKPGFGVPVFISLLSILVFYGTGHQAVMSTIQWKTAFIGFPTLTYPFSPILVALNTFGPIFLVALTPALYATWNVSPSIPKSASQPTTEADDRIVKDALKISLGVSLYHSGLTLGTAVSAAILRRHLMVWKVFAPRFMLGGIALIVVDLGLVVGIAVGLSRVLVKVKRTFGNPVPAKTA